MQRQDTEKPVRVRRLAQEYYEIARTLSGAVTTYDDYTPDDYKVTTQRERNKIMREVAKLADEAGVNHSELSYRETYVEAIKALGGTDEGNTRALRLRALAEDIDRRVRAKWREEKAPAAPPQSKRHAGTLASKTPNMFAPFGLLDGDVCEWEETDDIRPGEIVHYSEGGQGYIGRFVSLDDETLTTTNTSGEEVESDRADVSEFLRLVSYTRKVTLARTEPTAEGAPGDAPAPVIYMGRGSTHTRAPSEIYSSPRSSKHANEAGRAVTFRRWPRAPPHLEP